MLPVEVTPRLHSYFALAGLHRKGGRNRIGMLAGFTPEQCPVSRRNGGRNGPEYAVRFTSSFFVRIIEGEPLIGNIVQPPSFAADIDAGFIAMYQRRRYQLFFEP